MPIPTDRRLPISFPSAQDKDEIVEAARELEMSTSGYIIHRLKLLQLVEQTGAGKKLVESLSQALSVSD